MALRRYGDFRVEVFYFDSPCIWHYTNLIIIIIVVVIIRHLTWHGDFFRKV